MPKVTANKITIEYEERGVGSNPVVLLIMGLGQQMIAWPDAFVQLLVDEGFRVIRYDNRDVGGSSWLKGRRSVGLAALIAARRVGLRLPVPYTLGDMAEDAVGLMDALAIPAAHVVGASMGGMIAQHLASRAPERVLSLTSIMSSSGASGLPEAAPEIRARVLSKTPKNATAAQLMERAAETLRMISYDDPARPATAFDDIVKRAADRGYNPGGYVRQLMAILADGSRVGRLRKITVPTLIIHGAEDRLVPVACGIDTAKHIPGARLEIIDAMAHDIPPSQMMRISSLIADHAGAAGRA